MSRTYLYNCFHESFPDTLIRWPDSAMPIRVYIAPFSWYEKSKQKMANYYHQIILDSINEWSRISNGKIRFNIVDNLNASQIDFKWRRVDRKTLGHCTYEIDKVGRLFSASIEIGISDGILHAEYQDTNEVRHTVLHEIGHSLGLIGHSDHHKDIMYVPHQYGVFSLSPRDIETINWLYQLPVGFNYKNIGPTYRLKGNYTVNDVINAIERRILGEEEEEEALPAEAPQVVAQSAPQPSMVRSKKDQPLVLRTDSLDEQHDILSQMGRFHLKTQHVRIDPSKQAALKKMMLKNNPLRPFRPHQQPPAE